MIEIAVPIEMRSWSRAARAKGLRVGLVPTMGYLHEGHFRLMDRALGSADVVVSSVFVNPIQFGPGEDFATYPRDVGRDRAQVADRGIHCLFVPETALMYPTKPEVLVNPGSLATFLCGARRPGHFEGVLTVVVKLLNIVEPDLVVFGRKDAQQALMIRRMVEDLNFPIEVLIAPTVREPDGLAMSSRNIYLEPDERLVAPLLSQSLQAAHDAFMDGCDGAGRLVEGISNRLRSVSQIELEYAEIVDPRTLAPVDIACDNSIAAVAARLGVTRLIDNVVLGQGLAGDETVEQ